jgi:hypothetical protein
MAYTYVQKIKKDLHSGPKQKWTNNSKNVQNRQIKQHTPSLILEHLHYYKKYKGKNKTKQKTSKLT